MRLTGANFTAWYRDPSIWLEGVSHDGLTIEIDGSVYSDDVGAAESVHGSLDWLDDLVHSESPDDILPASSQITVLAGDLVDDDKGKPVEPVETSIQQWMRARKRNQEARVEVVVPTQEAERVRAVIREALDAAGLPGIVE